MHEHLKSKLETLPTLPGCYLMKNSEQEIIYVGKAKVLKNRVNQYFHGTHNYKTTKMVSNIHDFEYIVTGSEKEALILENNLIKKYRPRFNILMMDDKTYPYLRLTSEEHPRFQVVRNVKDKKAKHFGPFSDSSAAYDIMKLMNRIYPLRKCQHIPKKECLYYHMHQCLAPCIHEVNKEEYDQIRKSIISFMKGDTKEVMDTLAKEMETASENLDFERAIELRDLMNSITHMAEKQQMEIRTSKDFDVFSYYVDKGYIAIAGLMIRSGKLMERAVQVFDIYDEPSDVFVSYLMQYYESHLIPKELYVSTVDEAIALEEIYEVKVYEPQRGEKAKLVELAHRNAEVLLKQRFDTAFKENAKQSSIQSELEQLFGISPLGRIEMFDNSHISGTDRVSGMIVVENGEFVRSQYRKFKIKSDAKDDLSMMREVVYRRYLRLLKENKELPSVLLMDGGMLQIEVAKEIIDVLELPIQVFGLAKDDKHNTSKLFNSEGEEIKIDRKSEVFFFLTRMQDEVHRFAITFHQNARSKSMVQSELDSIPGVGEVRKKALLKHFKSVKRIREASLEELESVVGKSTALSIREYFDKV
ncbi:MAG: excinuclease ABC subunit UvrC [Erysipelotrichales bacterium]|nr:excinuclease ABC subunit UvrC [Erysipelotrichales bacterium]